MKRLKRVTLIFDSPDGHGKGRGYMVVPAMMDDKATKSHDIGGA